MDWHQLSNCIEKQSISVLGNNVKDMAILLGIGFRSRDIQENDIYIPLPFALLPSPFPKYWFEFAKSLQESINLLFHKVAHDYDFLKAVLKNTIEVDPFTGKLFEIYEIVWNEGFQQEYSLGILRSDYMLDVKKNDAKNVKMKQVEINTIASSLGSLAPRLRLLHEWICHQLHPDISVQLPTPENPSNDLLASGFIAAWDLYNSKGSAILFVVEEKTYNIFDHRALEFGITSKRWDIKVIRKKFSELAKESHLKNHRFYVGEQEIAIIYFRTGYSPEQFTEKDWETRLMMERSKAIKCPSIHYHLVGTKKVQQELSRPGVLERYMEKEAEIENLRSTFAGQYGLDLDEEGNNNVKKALTSPDLYVLKPQREGGGNNVFEPQKIKEMVQKNTKERSGYILMERFHPPTHANYFVKQGQDPTFVNCVSELGIFGVIIGSKDTILVNKEAGHLLRSKAASSTEGGLSAGFGALDTPFLTNASEKS